MSQEKEQVPQMDLPEQMRFRRDKLQKLEEAGLSPYRLTSCQVSHHALDIIQSLDELEGQEVSVAGRLMAKRGMGKVSFADLLDRTGSIQIFSRLDNLGQENYQAWQDLDLGDFLAVTGEVFRTRMGEISIRNASWTLLAKALRPLPEKYHGLKDTDMRYRKRYVDLMVNTEVRETFIKRSRIIQLIRHGPALCHPPQCSGPGSFPEEFTGALPQAPDRGRPGAGL